MFDVWISLFVMIDAWIDRWSVVAEAHSSTQAEVRALARENAELKLAKQKLVGENAEVRAEMEQAVLERDRSSLQHIQECKQLQAHIEMLNARTDQVSHRTIPWNCFIIIILILFSEDIIHVMIGRKWSQVHKLNEG